MSDYERIEEDRFNPWSVLSRTGIKFSQSQRDLIERLPRTEDGDVKPIVVSNSEITLVEVDV